MFNFPTPSDNTRLGFHYYPDTAHYRERDLQIWLPELQALGASWLTLISPSEYAIPEYFLRGLSESGIEPILHLPLPHGSTRQPSASGTKNLTTLKLLFTSYAHWGVHYVILFDRPNLRASWPVTGWAQSDLVERFLDEFLPIAELAYQSGLIPVFPPLEPGGDYWDTAFLRAALQAILRRNSTNLASKLVLSAYALNDQHPLNWGSGGPERWPGARPYHTSTTDEDQRGFRIFDWYLKITEAVTGHANPILLLGVGDYSDPSMEPTITMRNVVIARSMIRTSTKFLSQTPGPELPVPAEPLDPIPPQVLACNYWLLASVPDGPYSQKAWFQTEGKTLSVVDFFRQLTNKVQAVAAYQVDRPSRQPEIPCQQDTGTLLVYSPRLSPSASVNTRPIAHYLLLPTYEWGLSDWYLDAIRPFVKKYRPTIGFSYSEAFQAERVTVIGDQDVFPDDVINALRASGCYVQRIEGDGTSIATYLREA
jgi:hypothetical protein